MIYSVSYILEVVITRMNRKPTSKQMQLLIEILYVTFGSLLVAVSVNWVFVPSQTVTGGVTGVAILLHFLFNIPISVSSLAINIPLFLAGYRYLGGRAFALKTLYGIIALTLFLQLTEVLHQYPLTHNTLLASIYGGLLLGAGLGIVFRGRATTGGSDLAARLMQNITGVTAGKMLLVIDGSIITAAGVRIITSATSDSLRTSPTSSGPHLTACWWPVDRLSSVTGTMPARCSALQTWLPT